MSTTSVVLIDDHTLVRQAVAALIEAAPDLHVVGQAGSVKEANGLIADGLPDVVVVDVSMPDGNGLGLVAELRARSSVLGIVVLTMHSDDGTLLRALDSGASALVLKTAPADSILSAVRRAADSPQNFNADGLAAAVRRQGSAPRLTHREIEVLQLLADGQGVSSVARSLYMSESTVKTHISKIYDKLGARNRAAAVMAAVRLGLVDAIDH